jgi:hypothetical protein
LQLAEISPCINGKKAYLQARPGRAGKPFEKIFPKYELWGTNGEYLLQEM